MSSGCVLRKDRGTVTILVSRRILVASSIEECHAVRQDTMGKKQAVPRSDVLRNSDSDSDYISSSQTRLIRCLTLI